MAKLFKKKISFLLSGKGSNLLKILEQNLQKKKFFTHSIISSSSISREIKKFIKLNGLNSKIYERVSNISSKMLKDADLVFSVGYMKVLNSKVIENQDIINLHPSLLPNYKGLMTHKRMLINNEKNFGFTIHKVSAFLDSGEIVSQKKRVIKSNNEINLKKEHLKLEHKYVFKELIKYLN